MGGYRKPGVEPFKEAINRAGQMGWAEFDPVSDPVSSWVHVGVRTTLLTWKPYVD